MSPITTETKQIPGAQRPPLWRPSGTAAWPADTLPSEPPVGGPPDPVPIIDVDVTTLSFTAETTEDPAPPKYINVTNVGDIAPRMLVTVSDDADWLTVSPITSKASSMLTVIADPGALAVGFYTANIFIENALAPNSPQIVTVSFNVTEIIAPILIVDPESLTFTKVTAAADPVDQEIDISFLPEQQLDTVQDALNFTKVDGLYDPASQTIDITNLGTGVMDYLVTCDAPWLTLDPESGTAPDTVTVSVVQGALAAGDHEATITVTALGAVGSPKLIPVSFIITPSAGDFIDIDGDPDPDVGDSLIWDGTEFIEGSL